MSKASEETYREVIDASVAEALFRPGGKDARRYEPSNRSTPSFAKIPSFSAIHESGIIHLKFEIVGEATRVASSQT